MVDYGPRNKGIDWTQTNDTNFIEFRFGPIGDKATGAYHRAFNSAYNGEQGHYSTPTFLNMGSSIVGKEQDLIYAIHNEYQDDFTGERENILQEFIEVSLEVEKMHLAIGIVLSEMDEWLKKRSRGDGSFRWDDTGEVLENIIGMVFTSFTEEEGSPFDWPADLPKIEPFTSLLNLIAFIVKLLIGTLGFTIIYAIGIIQHMVELIIFGNGKNLIADLGYMVEDAFSEQFKKMNVMFKAHPNEIESDYTAEYEKVWKISPIDFPSEPFAYSNYEIIFGYEKLRGGYLNHTPQDFNELRKNIEIAHLYFVKHHMRPVLAIPNRDNPNSQVDIYYWAKDEMYISADRLTNDSVSEGFIYRLASMTQKRASYDIIRYCPNIIKSDYQEKNKNATELVENVVLIDDGYIEKEHSYNLLKIKAGLVRRAATTLKISKGGYAIKPKAKDAGEWNMSLGEHEEGQIRGMENTLEDKYENQKPDYTFYPTQLLFTIYGFRPPGFVNWYKNPLRTPLQQRIWPPPPPPKVTKKKHGYSGYGMSGYGKPIKAKRAFTDWDPPEYPPQPPAPPEPEPEPAPVPERRVRDWSEYQPYNPPEAEPEPEPAPRAVRGPIAWTEQDEAIFRVRRDRPRNENPEE